MPTFLLKKNFHTNLCQKLIEDIQFQRANYHYFLGRIAGVNEIVIDDSPQSEISTRSEIVNIKKVNSSDVSMVVSRINWVMNTVYTQFDSNIDITNSPYYVLTDNLDVYKCLDNNLGVPSTSKPTGVSISPIRTTDGYLWKFLYTIPAFKKNKFLSELRMPVQKSLSDRFYNNGSLDAANVSAGGSGYEVNLLTSISITGGTVGSGGTATGTTTSGAITTVTVTNGGAGYSKGCKVVVGGSGTGAVLTPVFVGGVITSITITNGGTGYGTVSLSIVVGGAIAIPSISRQTGRITKVTITNHGSGYNTIPTITITSPTGSGFYTENTTAIFRGIISEGRLVGVVILDSGKNYSYQTTPTITLIGDGKGASLTPVVDSDGVIVDVIVESGGTGYTFAKATVHGSGLGGAVGITLSESDFISDQANIEQTAIDGAIHKIVMVSSGSDYTVANITITGDGTGATAIAIINDGQITDIKMLTIGSGYTHCDVVITGNNTFSNPNATVGSAYGILSPIGGHGFDAITELGGDTICLFSGIRNQSSTQIISQDFREYGVIKNLKDLFTGNLVSKDSGLCAYTVRLNNITGLVKDEIIFVGNSEFRVVEIYASNSTVILTPLSKNPLNNFTTLTSTIDLSRQYIVSEILSIPVADKYSGQMIIVSNSDAFTFSSEQEVTIKTFIKL